MSQSIRKKLRCFANKSTAAQKAEKSANKSNAALNSLSEEIPPADWIIKTEVWDKPAEHRNTGAAGPRHELPLTPGSPPLPGAWGVIC